MLLLKLYTIPNMRPIRSADHEPVSKYEVDEHGVGAGNITCLQRAILDNNNKYSGEKLQPRLQITAAGYPS